MSYAAFHGQSRLARARLRFRAEEIQAVARPLPGLLAIFALFYAAQLTSFRIPIDGELAALRAGDATAWLAQGRWGIYLIERYLLPQPTVPFLPLALFGCFMSCAYLFFLRAHGILQVTLRHYAAFPIFAAFPIWFFLTEFPANTPCTGLGVALIGLALVAFRAAMQARQAGVWGRMQWGWFAVQAVLITLAISLYQTLVLVLLAGGLGAIAAASLRGELRPVAIVAEVLLLGWAAVVGFVLYVAAWKLSLAALGIQPDYVTYFMRPGELLDAPLRTALNTMWQIRQVYQGGAWTYGIECRAFALLPVLGILAVVTTPLLRGQAVTRLLALGLTGAVLAAPFAMNLASGGTMPPRTLVAAPAALWFTVLLGLEFGSPWLRRATVLATLAASAQALYVFALFQAADAVAKQRDEQLAAAIYARIAEVRPDLAYGDPIKLDVFGGQPLRSPYPRVKDSTVGASVFEWDGGNPYRIASLYRVLGYSGIVPVDDEQRRRLLPVFASMPVWPAKGSVRAEGDATLVKLGNTPGNVHDVLLHNAPRMAPVSFPPEPPPGGG